MNRAISRSAVVMGILSAAVYSSSAFAQTSLYRDDFYVTKSWAGDGMNAFVRPAVDTGWYGFSDNPAYDPGTVTSFLAEAPISYWNNTESTSTPTNPGYLTGATANAGESGTNPGSIFWSPLVRSIAIYTDKSSIVNSNLQASHIGDISFDYHSNPANNTTWNLSALVEVNNNWYASTTGINNNSATSTLGYASVACGDSGGGWNTYTIHANTSKWYAMDLYNPAPFFGGDPGVGPIFRQINSTAISLPAGTIQGLGLCTLVNPVSAYNVPTDTSPPGGAGLLITDYNVTPELTWDNTGGSGDGIHWDTIRLNFNNGNGPVRYTDGSLVTFNDANNGHYAVTLNGAVNPGSVTFSNSAGNYTVSGSGSIAGWTSVVVNAGATRTVTLSTTNTYTGGTFVNSGTLIAGAINAIPSNSALTIGTATATATVQLAAPQDSVTALSSLTLNAGSTLDVNNNRLAVDYAPGSSNYSAVLASVVASYDGNKWDNPGITSSAIKAILGGPHPYALAVVDGNDPNNTTSLTGNTTYVIPALEGDIRLTGTVDFGDYQIILSNYGIGTTWETGDFHYSGTTSFGDYQHLLQNFGAVSSLTASQLASIEAFGAQLGAVVTPNADGFGFNVTVPEPSSMTLLACGLAVGTSGRRRDLKSRRA